PTRPIILERDLRSELHQLFFRKLIAQTRIQIVRNIRRRSGECASQVDDKSLGITEWRQIVSRKGTQFLIVQACFSAYGRIDVYSKRTADARSSADSSQLNVAQ